MTKSLDERGEKEGERLGNPEVPIDASLLDDYLGHLAYGKKHTNSV